MIIHHWPLVDSISALTIYSVMEQNYTSIFLLSLQGCAVWLSDHSHLGCCGSSLRRFKRQFFFNLVKKIAAGSTASLHLTRMCPVVILFWYGVAHTDAHLIRISLNMQLNGSHNIGTVEGFFLFSHCCSLAQCFDCCETVQTHPRETDCRMFAAFRLLHCLQPVSLVDSDPWHLFDVTENRLIANPVVVTQQVGVAVLSCWDDFLSFPVESFTVTFASDGGEGQNSKWMNSWCTHP